MPQLATFRGPRAGRTRGGASWVFSAVCSWVALSCAVMGANAQAQSAPEGAVFIAGNGDRAGADAAQMNAMLATSATRAKPGANGAGSPMPAAAPNLRAASYADLNSHGVPEDARAGVDTAGMITIPGPGERAQPGDAPQIVTIPAPGANPAAARPAAFPARPAQAAQVAQPMRIPSTTAAAANAANAANAGGMQRVSLQTAATRVAPVTVNAAATAPAQPAQPAAPGTSAVTPNTPATPPGQQDGESIRAAALAYLQQQSAGLPGKVGITVGPAFPRGLAACTSLEPFMPPGARMMGRTTVGVRCVGAKPWTLYLGARIEVDITYYVAARQIGAGEAISAADLSPRAGDLAMLPQTIITDPNQASGAVALARISAGLPLRTDMVRSASSVVIGQMVKVVAVGTNFTISAEGSALNNAEPGQQVRVRTSGGQIITGVVKDAGTVEIQI
ncbi:flagellar basal body P-ring formation chaperone FlgA [Paraburkholderia acidisoli]|uniref:Flagellar basal body P-ring formation protein FlgA n=1 Tax=Paraburkholderia acidisoli TaxID=2571748 RepID=A0A7Z2GIY7_9BURK|nr:flagellar basal body P-ring formation chaperone FlgA [Paraburkholderia acidisoli]QGZ62673.1 flagellar basal body P-ring formation protein FlgA [Paraburkholderia acidisoli]